MTTPAESAVAPGKPVTDVPTADLPGVPLDVSGSTRLPVVMEMVAGLSSADDPNDVLREFAKGFEQLYGRQGYVSLSVRGLEPGQYKITRMITDGVPDNIGEDDPWRHWSRLATHTDGLFGRIIRNPYPQILHQLDLRDDPVVGDTLAKYGSMMAVPLFDGGEALNWSISFREDPEGFSLQELEENVLRANLGGSAVKNAVITRELREAHAALHDEVEQIAKIQRALLPDSIPQVPGLELGTSYETFDQAGGDMYAVRPLRKLAGDEKECSWDCEGPWGLLIADVSGHGPAAAVVMAMMQSIIDTYPKEPTGPAEVLEYANRHLATKRIESRFVTALLAMYDPKTLKLTYARAGHNPPVWMRPAGAEGEGWDMGRLDRIGGIPLGIIPEVTYEEETIQLESGQTVVFYTDGITEAMDAAGEMFDVDGIEGSLTECTGWPQCVIGHITENLKVHQGSVRPKDDQTLVVMRVV